MQQVDSRQQFEELLPWYVNSTLGSDERAFVQQYLDANPTSRNAVLELEHLRQCIREEVQAVPEDIGYAAFNARLRSADSAPRAPVRTPGALDRLRDYLASFFARPAYLVAACVILAQAGVIGALLHGSGADSAAEKSYSEYRSQPSTPLEIAVPLLRITFRASATEAEIRALLIDISGSIVGGPSQFGDYLVLVEASRVESLAPRLASNHIIDNVTVVRKNSD